MTKSGILWQKEKLLVLSNFCFCHYVFKKPSAAEASESVCTRERVKVLTFQHRFLLQTCHKQEQFNPFPHIDAF